MALFHTLLVRLAAVLLTVASLSPAGRRGCFAATPTQPRRSSRPGTGSSARFPAAWRRWSSGRSPVTACRTATSSARRARAPLSAALRYGDGVLYTKMEGQQQVYWQGPSIGWDIGGDGNRTMMLVYDLPNSLAIYRRYGGVNGSAYLVGGLGMTVLANTRDPRPHGLCRPDPDRCRRPPWDERRLPEIHAAADLEPLLRTCRACPACPNSSHFVRI